MSRSGDAEELEPLIAVAARYNIIPKAFLARMKSSAARFLRRTGAKAVRAIMSPSRYWTASANRSFVPSFGGTASIGSWPSFRSCRLVIAGLDSLLGGTAA